MTTTVHPSEDPMSVAAVIGLPTVEQSETETRNAAIRQMAKDEWNKDGEIEIDDGAVVSEGDDNGAYVAAWVWVGFGGTELDKDRYQCQNCSKTWRLDQLRLDIPRYHERVAPDEDEPAGECPECGALCHEVDGK